MLRADGVLIKVLLRGSRLISHGRRIRTYRIRCGLGVINKIHQKTPDAKAREGSLTNLRKKPGCDEGQPAVLSVEAVMVGVEGVVIQVEEPNQTYISHYGMMLELSAPALVCNSVFIHGGPRER